jgi:hypothetical protein
MKRLLIVAAVLVVAAPALAGSDVLPIDGVSGYLRFDVATGQVTPVTAETRRLGPPVWEASYDYVNYFWSAAPFAGEASIDWGDLTSGQAVGGFGFSEFTNSQAAAGDLYAVFLFYEEENGWDSAGRVYTAGYLIANIPGSTHPVNEYWGYIWGVEIFDPFVLDGSDMDGDGLGDWGYWAFFSGQSPNCLHGPGIAGLIDPNNIPPECPGVENVFDLFVNTAYNGGPNNIDPNNIEPDLAGTYWFGGFPFSQWHFVLYAPVCPNRGDAGRYCEADIDGSFDCIVGLADLAQLLGNYGMTTGAVLMDGDVDPYDEWFPGDGDVDLADLAELLSQYGDDCNLP